MKYTVIVIDNHDYPLFKVGTYESIHKANAVTAECEECCEHFRTKIISEGRI